jgi:hypothetical protein
MQSGIERVGGLTHSTTALFVQLLHGHCPMCVTQGAYMHRTTIVHMRSVNL